MCMDDKTRTLIETSIFLFLFLLVLGLFILRRPLAKREAKQISAKVVDGCLQAEHTTFVGGHEPSRAPAKSGLFLAKEVDGCLQEEHTTFGGGHEPSRAPAKSSLLAKEVDGCLQEEHTSTFGGGHEPSRVPAKSGLLGYKMRKDQCVPVTDGQMSRERDGNLQQQDEITVPGCPFQVIKVTDDHRFELQVNALEEILLQDHVKDKGVVVVSVAGAFRKGKSFLLNFFLRFLSQGGSDGWIGDNDEPLTGFKWVGGSNRETTGIWMWSHVFVCPGPNNEEVAVLLMDTQGVHDTVSTVQECTTVFALSTLLSSVQVYNLSMDIQENNLQDLELFINYGQLAMQDDNTKPFQNLMFLVRDWNCPYEAEYGLKGGQQHLDKRLQINETQHEEIQTVRKHIKNVFKEIQCFLMPHPGHIIVRNANFDGRIQDIAEEFRDEIQVLTHHLLASKNLVIKEVNGNMLNGADLLMYFKKYTEIFQENTLPELKTILQANSEANHESVVANCLRYYEKQMKKICGGDRQYLIRTVFQKKHTSIKRMAVNKFLKIRKMGGKHVSERYLQILISGIEKKYNRFVKHNDSKSHDFKKRIIGTSAVAVVGAVVGSGVAFVGGSGVAFVGGIGLLSFALLGALKWLTFPHKAGSR